MVGKEELRPGNYIFAETYSGYKTIIRINSIKDDSIAFTMDYPNSDCLEEEYSMLEWESTLPIPLNKKWKELLGVDFNYPQWIKYVHELQNWYYWTNGKKELDTSRIPMTEGDNVHLNHLEELLKEE